MGPPSHSHQSEPRPSDPESGKPIIWKNLGIRAVSAVIFAVICFIPLYFGGILWAGFAALIGARLYWEWVNMSDPEARWPAVFIPVVGLAAAIYFLYIQDYNRMAIIVGLSAICAMVYSLKRGRILWTVLGVFYIAIPSLMMVWLRGVQPGFVSQGFQSLMFIILVVAASDTAAYFGGSFFKGPKIMPKLSPNKTWSGFVSGFIFALFIAFIFAIVLAWPRPAILAWGAFIVIISVVGDFFESGLKRRLNVKDAGELLPGHGGMLDRLDALMMASAIVGLVLIYNPNLWFGV